MPMRSSIRSVVFINTSEPSKRTFLLKPVEVLQDNASFLTLISYLGTNVFNNLKQKNQKTHILLPMKKIRSNLRAVIRRTLTHMLPTQNNGENNISVLCWFTSGAPLYLLIFQQFSLAKCIPDY